ncbi:MAG: hypothetical protein U9N87_04685 [Planctomycetota bacterium]|nr:hypothetical protein [Planctomycetota bacterium]
MAEVCQAAAAGDYSRNIEIEGDNDEPGMALFDMAKTLHDVVSVATVDVREY